MSPASASRSKFKQLPVDKHWQKGDAVEVKVKGQGEAQSLAIFSSQAVNRYLTVLCVAVQLVALKTKVCWLHSLYLCQRRACPGSSPLQSLVQCFLLATRCFADKTEHYSGKLWCSATKLGPSEVSLPTSFEGSTACNFGVCLYLSCTVTAHLALPIPSQRCKRFARQCTRTKFTTHLICLPWVAAAISLLAVRYIAAVTHWSQAPGHYLWRELYIDVKRWASEFLENRLYCARIHGYLLNHHDFSFDCNGLWMTSWLLKDQTSPFTMIENHDKPLAVWRACSKLSWTDCKSCRGHKRISYQCPNFEQINGDMVPLTKKRP